MLHLDPLAVDIYPGDGTFNILGLAQSGYPWSLVMGKSTQGLKYYYEGWFNWFWKTAGQPSGFGVNWFRTSYHYFDCSADAIKQADFALKAVENAGGYGKGDIYHCIDVEAGDQAANVTHQQIVDGVSAYTAEIKAKTGKGVILYGGSYLRDKGVKERMGCDYCWPADYGSSLSPYYYESIGFDLASLFGWQAVGINNHNQIEGKWDVHGYPLTTPVGKADISAVVVNKGGSGAMQVMQNMAKQVSAK